MNREVAFGLLLMGLLLGGIFLFSRRPVASANYASANQGNIRVVPIQESPHYRNKETRLIEYNSDGLPTKIEIIRDYTIA